jgi:hypothetical protein
LGRDFRIIKEKKPSDKWANYGTSKWSGKVRALSEEENIAIQEHGLFNLGTFLGEQPDANGIALIKGMFEDSFNGRPFDFESYGHAYRAYKIRGGERRADADAITHVAERSEPEARKTEVRKAAPVETSDDEAPSSKPSADDFLRKLKEKHAKKA